MFIQLMPDFGVLGTSASPSLCYLCGSDKQGADEGVCSLGVHIEGEGKLEVCRNCVLEMGGLFGVSSPEKAEGLRTKNRQLGMQVKALLASRDAAQAQIDALRDEVEALRDALRK